MKLVRYGPKGKEKPGIIDGDGKLRSLAKVVKDIDGEALSPAGLAKIKKANVAKLPKVCLLYTSDAADERSSVDLGGRRTIKKKKTNKHTVCTQRDN